VIAALEVRHAFTHFFDDPSAFMAEDRGGRERQLSLQHGQIRVADTAGRQAHDHFVVAWRVELHRLDDERFVEVVHHCAFDHHVSSSRALMSPVRGSECLRMTNAPQRQT